VDVKDKILAHTKKLANHFSDKPLASLIGLIIKSQKIPHPTTIIYISISFIDLILRTISSIFIRTTNNKT